MELQGIDVSRYQNTINWKKVKAAGKKFVMIKLGWAGWAGELSQDVSFKANIEGAIAAGLDVGVYVYSYCKTPQAAKMAAQATLKAVKPYTLTYPIAFDIEDTSASGTEYNKMSKTQNNAIVLAFLDEISAANYYAILYTYKSFADSYLDMSKLVAYDVWIAQYAEKCTYTGNYGMWQYAGETGRCDGITGACDLNVSYKDYAAIIKSAGLNGFDKEMIIPSIVAISSNADENIKLRSYVTFLESKLKAIKMLANSALSEE